MAISNEKKEDTLKRFIRKMILKVICIAIFLNAAFLFQTPTITNEMALMQMQASDDMLMFWEVFNKIRPIIRTILYIISGYIIGSAGNDIYKFTRKYKHWEEFTTTEQEKEN